jgi:hypothetical protein
MSIVLDSLDTRVFLGIYKGGGNVQGTKRRRHHA